MNLSSNLIRYSNDETIFPHKLLSTKKKVSKTCTTFAIGSSADFPKNLLSKMIQSGEFNNFNLMNPVEVVYKTANKARDLSNKVLLNEVKKQLISLEKMSRKFLDISRY